MELVDDTLGIIHKSLKRLRTGPLSFVGSQRVNPLQMRSNGQIYEAKAKSAHSLTRSIHGLGLPETRLAPFRPSVRSKP